MGNSITLHRVLRAPAQVIYRAFLEPAAMCKWLPPHGFVAQVHSSDPRIGGSYTMSFTNFRTGQTHSFGGTYVELTPHSKIRYTDAFDDPNLPGTMAVTISLRPVTSGTDVTIKQENVPDAIPPEMCYMGWQESLSMLAQLVEPEIP
jgi:uncharacterized protein YndB with AHSA1/START domain